MTKFKLRVLFLILIPLCFCGFSQSYILYRDSIFSALKKQDYTQANSFLNHALKKFPDTLELWYLSFAIEQARILDYESCIIEGEGFINATKNLKKKFETKLNSLKDKELVLCRFYIANILGGMSIIQAKTNNWIEAAKNAHQAVTELKALIKMYPDISAAYLGVGMFDYYLNQSIKKIIPFVQDKSSDAIKTLQIALSAEYPFGDAAKSSLCWVLIDYGNFKRADSIAKAVLLFNPDHSAFIRIRAFCALWSGKYALANELGCTLVQNALSRIPLNWSDFVSGSYIMVYSSYTLGNFEEALIASDNPMLKEIPRELKDVSQLQKYLKYITETRAKCLSDRNQRK